MIFSEFYRPQMGCVGVLPSVCCLGLNHSSMFVTTASADQMAATFMPSTLTPTRERGSPENAGLENDGRKCTAGK